MTCSRILCPSWFSGDKLMFPRVTVAACRLVIMKPTSMTCNKNRNLNKKLNKRGAQGGLHSSCIRSWQICHVVTETSKTRHLVVAQLEFTFQMMYIRGIIITNRGYSIRDQKRPNQT